MKILHLVLKYKWFDMIASGEKKEEYRALTNYWKSRLEKTRNHPFVWNFKEYDAVRFQRGYVKNPPTILVECKGIDIDEGIIRWGAGKDKDYYVIKLGERIEDKT